MANEQAETDLPNSAVAVAIDILVNGPLSRASVATRLGLSSPTLTRVVKPLLDSGLLVEEGAVRQPGRGRASLPLNVAATRFRFIGVKIQPEAIYAVLTDLRATIVTTAVVPLTAADVDTVVLTVGAVVAQLQAGSRIAVTAVGITVGGRVEGGDVVANSPFMGWTDVALRPLLQARLPVPVHLDNDAVGLTKAQHWFGSGRHYANFALLTIGTGIGYGLVIADAFVRTPQDLLTHTRLDPSGPLCPDGHRGCLLAYLSSGSITAAVRAVLGGDPDYDGVLALASAGNPVARRVVDESAYALGVVSAAVTAMTGVQRVILSGEGVHLANIAGDALEKGLRSYAPGGVELATPLVRPMSFIEWARGSAVLAIQAEFPRLGTRAATP